MLSRRSCQKGPSGSPPPSSHRAGARQPMPPTVALPILARATPPPALPGIREISFEAAKASDASIEFEEHFTVPIGEVHRYSRVGTPKAQDRAKQLKQQLGQGTDSTEEREGSLMRSSEHSGAVLAKLGPLTGLRLRLRLRMRVRHSGAVIANLGCLAIGR